MAETSPLAPSPTGSGTKSSHKTYISDVESLAAKRKLELEKVIENTKEAEREKRKKRQAAVRASAEEFDTITDMPPKLRALTEDIKVLKDRVKKYKEKATASEVTISSQQSQILKLQEKCASLQETLQKCNRNPKQVMDEAQMLEQIKSKDATIEDLEHRLVVVTKSKEADLRKFKASFSDRRRKEEEFKAQIETLKGYIEEKDKEMRASALKIRSLQKKLEPVRRSPPVPKPEPPPPQPEESEEGSSFFMTEVAGGGAAPAEPPVKIVIRILGDGPPPAPQEEDPLDAEEWGEDASRAATKIQAVHRGRATRTALRERDEQAKAATKIQAAHRGKSERARLAARKAEAN